ncbi:dihydrodipicolinate synthase family protein, partial [Clostridium sporogenes]
VHNMCELYLNGKVNEALKIQLDSLALTNALFIETNPIPVKTAMNLMNMKVGDLRLPLCEMNENNLEVLKKELKAYNLM